MNLLFGQPPVADLRHTGRRRGVGLNGANTHDIAPPGARGGRRAVEIRLSLKGQATFSSRPPSVERFPEPRGLTVANDEPMTASVAGRYASALLELAQDQKVVAAVEADLNRFDAMLNDSPDLVAFVRSPILSVDDQVRALAALLSRAGIAGTAGNFLLLVARNRRLFAITDMIKTFRTLAARARGEASAEVTSAVPMTDAQMMALKAELKAIAGKDVVVSPKVDPSLLGGLVVKIGSRMIDSSLKTKLTNLGVALKSGA